VAAVVANANDATGPMFETQESRAGPTLVPLSVQDTATVPVARV